MKIEVTVEGRAVRGFSKNEIADFTRGALKALRTLRSFDFEVDSVSIRFVDDAEMRTLNRTFRKKDKTTDVLTFLGDDELRAFGEAPLGDIVISLDQARRQAADERHSLVTELRYLILHGVIHALGYDHENDDGEMNALELKARKKVGLE